MGELANKIRAKYPGSYDSIPDAELESKIIAKYPGVYDHLAGDLTDQRDPFDYSPQETEVMRRKFVSDTGTLGQRAKEYIPSRQTVANYSRPVLQAAGTVIGGIAGAAGGGTAGLAGGPAAPGTVPYGAIIGGIAGAGGGYAIGNKAADLIAGESAPIKDQAIQSLNDFKTGAEMEMGGQLTGRLLNAGLTKLANSQTLNNIVRKGIEKGIRPSIEGNRTAPQQQKYMGNAVSAVKSIVANKENLQLTDEFGETIKTLPQNLKQFGQAIDQTKRNIFTQYNTMAQQAGEVGANVDLRPISNELVKASNDKVLNTMAPATAKYAAERAQALSKVGQFTADEAQNAIAIANQSLEAFYKNPGYDTASKAYVDALVVNRLRNSLDSVIEGVSGPGYQDLKRQYGALKAIEKDVNRRSIVDARRNDKGLIDFSDIFSGSEMVRGVLSMNPSTVAAGGTAKLIARLYKLKNDPNRIVKGMFDKVGKRLPPSTPTEVSEVPPVLPTEKPFQYGGAVNTLNNPVGVPTFFDKTIGTNIPVSNSDAVHQLNNLSAGPERYFDKTIGAWTTRSQ